MHYIIILELITLFTVLPMLLILIMQILNVEVEFGLREQCRDMIYLGERDTFAFEERFYLNKMVKDALNRDLEKAKAVHEARRKSIWLNHEERLIEWSLAARARIPVHSAHLPLAFFTCREHPSTQ